VGEAIFFPVTPGGGGGIFFRSSRVEVEVAVDVAGEWLREEADGMDEKLRLV